MFIMDLTVLGKWSLLDLYTRLVKNVYLSFQVYLELDKKNKNRFYLFNSGEGILYNVLKLNLSS